MLQQLDQSQQEVENNRKNWAEEFARVEREIRQIINGANGKSVECRSYDQFSGKLGSIVTVVFTKEGDKVFARTVSEPLPESRH